MKIQNKEDKLKMPRFINVKLETGLSSDSEQLCFCIQSSFVNHYNQKYLLLDKQKNLSQPWRFFSTSETVLNFRDFAQLRRLFSTSENFFSI